VIPKIFTITESDSPDEIIAQFAHKFSIPPSYQIVIQPEKDELTVEQIHIMQRDIQVSFDQTALVVLIAVENSSNEVQNSLLKSLEEDSTRIQFLLLVKNPAGLISTILSRCSLEIREENERLVLENYKLILFSFQNNSEVKKEEALIRIDAYLGSHPSPLKSGKLLSHILNIRRLIKENNMNPTLALDAILIFLSKTSTMNKSYEKK